MLHHTVPKTLRYYVPTYVAAADTRDACDNLYRPNVGSLDDGEVTKVAQNNEEDGQSGSAIETLLRSRDLSLPTLVGMSHMERIKWRVGIQISMPLLSKRLFNALDFDDVGLLPVESLEYIINFLACDFPIGKATTDIVQVSLQMFQSKCLMGLPAAVCWSTP